MWNKVNLVFIVGYSSVIYSGSFVYVILLCVLGELLFICV